jgi:DNA-binding NtrC family response regulator
MSQQDAVVLLVEDEDSLRLALTRTLVCANLKVVGARNGKLAGEEVPKLADSLRLLVTDIKMPVMNGFELARALRSIQPAIPILFITGVGTGATAVEAGRLGAEVLLKPFCPDHFLDIVTRLMAQAPVAHGSLA